MAQDAVINGTTLPGVETVVLKDAQGNEMPFYPDAVRYNAQTLTEAQKAQARQNIGAQAELTAADQEAIVQQVILALGTPVFGTVDADKNITLTGELADGTYTIQYEDEEGNVTVIGTYTKAPKPTYTNRLPLAINSDGTPYNGGKGWKAGTRLNSSGAESTSNAAELEVTGFISVKNGDKVYLGNITMNNGTYANQTYMWLYDSSFNALSGRYRLYSQFSDEKMAEFVSKGTLVLDDIGNVTMLTIDHDLFYTGASLADMSNVAYLRISCEKIDNDSIITVNEPIA